MAFTITPLLRDLIDGPVPLASIEKPTPGTGATLLVEAAVLIATGREGAASIADAGEDEAEWRKQITAALRDGPAAIFIDNVKSRLASRHLAKVLTLTEWSDRILGLSKTVLLPNGAVWAATGNNIAANLQIVRRSYRLRLDAGLERPWLRQPTEFEHPDLPAWVRAERARLVWAGLTLIQSWLAAGRPPGAGTLGKFEQFVEVVGGVLAHAEIPGLLGNLEQAYEIVDEESDDVRRFLAAWWVELKDGPALASRLYTVATAPDVHFPLGGKDDAGRHLSLSHRLRALRGRAYRIEEDLTVAVAKAEKNEPQARAGLWRLVEVKSRDARDPRDLSNHSRSDFGVSAQHKSQSARANDRETLSNLSDLSNDEPTWRCPCEALSRAVNQFCENCGGGRGAGSEKPAAGGEAEA